jgi:hypothetical protein
MQRVLMQSRWCACRGIKTLPELRHNLLVKRYVWNLTGTYTLATAVLPLLEAALKSFFSTAASPAVVSCWISFTDKTMNFESNLESQEEPCESHWARYGEYSERWVVRSWLFTKISALRWRCNKAMVQDPVVLPFSAFCTESKSSNSSEPRYEKRHLMSVVRQKFVVNQDRQCTDNVTSLKWISNEYYTTCVCVCVCSMRHQARNAHVPYCHLWPDPPCNIFPLYYINDKIFEIKKLLNAKCVFRVSLKLFPETFFILRRTERHMIQNVYWSACKVPFILVRF